jgi:hypothetical protein
MANQHVTSTRISRKHIAIAALTISVNLLQTTLAGADANRYTSQTVIIRGIPSARPNVLTIINNNLQNTLIPPVVAEPFVNNTPNPTLARKTNAIGWIRTFNPLLKEPFVLSKFPNPQLKKQPTLTWIHSRNSALIEPISISEQIFRNPQVKKLPNVGFTQKGIQEVLVIQNPFTTARFPNPIRVNSQLSISISSKPGNDGDKAFTPIDWRNPDLRKKQPTIFSSKLLPILTPPTLPPFVPVDYPNPKLPKRATSNLTHTFNFKPPEPPVGFACAITLGIGAPGDLTCFTLVGLSANPSPAIPSIQSSQPRFILETKRAITWINATPFYYQGNIPPGIQTTINPVRRIKPVPNTWIQRRPIFYVEPGGVPFVGQIFRNPVRVKTQLSVTISTRSPAPISTIFPFSQKDWPNPARKKIHPKWEDYYVIDDNLPKIQSSTALPLRKRPFVPTWIQSAQVRQELPLRNYIYPNPIIVKQHTQTWIVGLLQSTLEPPPQDPPFYQTEWPNPVLRIKVPVQDWLDIPRKFQIEVSLQPAQYDWPVFRAVKRAHVGFVHFVIPSEEPFFTTAAELPLRKLRIAETWIDSPIIFASIPPGEVPFNQTSWPLFLKRVYPVENLTVIGQNPIDIPVVIGRGICLLADATEYILLSEIQPFDLPADATEYDLEADGKECD